MGRVGGDRMVVDGTSTRLTASAGPALSLDCCIHEMQGHRLYAMPPEDILVDAEGILVLHARRKGGVGDALQGRICGLQDAYGGPGCFFPVTCEENITLSCRMSMPYRNLAVKNGETTSGTVTMAILELVSVMAAEGRLPYNDRREVLRWFCVILHRGH